MNKGECLPEHFSNAKNVYITVVRGTLSATLNEQETHEYQDSLDNYLRKQDVKKVYRKQNREYILVDCVSYMQRARD